MKLIELANVKGEDVLARAIVTEEYNELLPKGTVLKKEYVNKLLSLGITEVYIEGGGITEAEAEILKEEVKEKCKEQVQNVISRHTYKTDNSDMEILSHTTEDIISNILEDENVVEQVYEIKERSADIYEHSISVCSLSMLVALRLKLDKEAVRDIGLTIFSI